MDDYTLPFTQEITLPFLTSPLTEVVGSGDAFFFEAGSSATLDQDWLPENDVSGQTVSGSFTFAKTGLANIGATLGSFLFAWENSNTGASDPLTVKVGTVAPVPLPAGFSLLLAGMDGLGLFRRHKKADILVSLWLCKSKFFAWSTSTPPEQPPGSRRSFVQGNPRDMNSALIENLSAPLFGVRRWRYETKTSPFKVASDFPKPNLMSRL